MKYIKISAIIFSVTLLLSAAGAMAANWAGYADVTVKRLSGSTLISTHDKYNYGYQSVQLSSALDDLSSDERAMQAKVTNSSWIDMRKGKHDKFNEELTYFPADGYQHYVRAKRSTLSTTSYWGFWFWDVEMAIES